MALESTGRSLRFPVSISTSSSTSFQRPASSGHHQARCARPVFAPRALIPIVPAAWLKLCSKRRTCRDAESSVFPFSHFVESVTLVNTDVNTHVTNVYKGVKDNRKLWNRIKSRVRRWFLKTRASSLAADTSKFNQLVNVT